VALAPSPALRWSEQASARLERVPEGFMRDLARRRVASLAAERGLERVELGLAEEGIARCREEMESAMTSGAVCPVPHAQPASGSHART
jgi:hypothetical protein